MRLAHARLVDGSIVDIDLDPTSGSIARVSPAGSTPAASERIDLGGATVIPGLWDEHTHIVQWAQYRSRPSVLHAVSAAEAAAIARDAVAERRERGIDEPLVVVGMRDGLWADAPSRALLDAATGELPVLILSSDVHSSWPNSAMARLLGLGAERDGRSDADDDALLREDVAFDALTRLEAMRSLERADALVVEALAAATSRGVVGVVDLEFDDAVGAWQRKGRATPVRIEAGVYAKDLELAAERGIRSGTPIAHAARVGRLKVISDGSLGTRTAWTSRPYGLHGHGDEGCGVRNVDDAELDRLLARAGALGLGATVHAIGDAAVGAAIDAFERAGRGGRIEHVQLATAADAARMGALGIEASVQPEHVLDDRELVARMWSDREDDAYRLRSLADAGVRIVLGSDAPVSPLEPWTAIAAAVTRTRGDEEPVRPHEAISLEQALAASARSSIAVGQPADLAVLGAPLPSTQEIADDPNEASRRLRAMPVEATWIAGRLVHGAL